MDNTDDKIKLLIERLKTDGIVKSTVKDGHLFGFSKEKLTELLIQVEKSGQDYLILHIKDPGKLN